MFNPEKTVKALQLKPVKVKGGALIDYATKTATRPIPVEFHGSVIYASRPLTHGNSKLDPSVAIFDMLAGKTCPNCAQCYRDCYARDGERRYPATFNRRLINSYRALFDLPRLEADICAQIAEQGIRTVRIHSSGDFLSPAYSAMWVRIAEKFPRVAFYTYTKSPYAPRGSRINVVDSLPDGRPNFGEYEEIIPRAKKFNAPICPYRTRQWCADRGIEHKEIHCGAQCRACFTERVVFFVKH